MPVPLLRFEWRARLLRGSEDTLPGVSRPTGQVASSSTTWRNKPCAMATVDIHSSADDGARLRHERNNEQARTVVISSQL